MRMYDERHPRVEGSLMLFIIRGTDKSNRLSARRRGKQIKSGDGTESWNCASIEEWRSGCHAPGNQRLTMISLRKRGINKVERVLCPLHTSRAWHCPEKECRGLALSFSMSAKCERHLAVYTITIYAYNVYVHGITIRARQTLVTMNMHPAELSGAEIGGTKRSLDSKKHLPNVSLRINTYKYADRLWAFQMAPRQPKCAFKQFFKSTAIIRKMRKM